MVDEAEPDRLQRIEMIARKVPPLSYVLFLYLFLTCPIWIPATVAAVAELVSVSLPEIFYSAIRWTTGGGLIVSYVVTMIAVRRAVRRQVALAEDAADISRFRLGWGVVRAAWKSWWSLLVAILFVVYFVAGKGLLETSVGVSRQELTEVGSYWIVVARAAVISGLIFCFLGFCVWLGHRVQKQRAAEGRSA